MMSPRIEKDVPIPNKQSEMARLLSGLDIGESFEFKDADMSRKNAYVVALRVGIKITIRGVSKRAGTYRIWRTE